MPSRTGPNGQRKSVAPADRSVLYVKVQVTFHERDGGLEHDFLVVVMVFSEDRRWIDVDVWKWREVSVFASRRRIPGQW
jgi:hypothetical protein